MKEEGVLFRIGYAAQIVEPKNKKKFSLEELQKFVGGYIEIVPGTSVRGKPTAYCNEEGLCHGLQYNAMASMYFGVNLVGDVIQVKRIKEVKVASDKRPVASEGQTTSA